MASIFIQIVLIVLVVGLILWLVNQFLPIDARFKQIITVVSVVGVVVYIIWALATAAKLV